MNEKEAQWRDERNHKIRVKIFGTDNGVVSDYQDKNTMTANSSTGYVETKVASETFLVSDETSSR